MEVEELGDEDEGMDEVGEEMDEANEEMDEVEEWIDAAWEVHASATNWTGSNQQNIGMGDLEAEIEEYTEKYTNTPVRGWHRHVLIGGRYGGDDWSCAEHQRFVHAMTLFAKSSSQTAWKLVSEYVRTRTGAQCRSYSQRWEQRQKKGEQIASQSRVRNEIVYIAPDKTKIHSLLAVKRYLASCKSGPDLTLPLTPGRLGLRVSYRAQIRAELEKTPKHAVGKRIAKQFGERWFAGTVASIVTHASYGNGTDFFIKYDDGDSEHVGFSALVDLMENHAIPEVRNSCAKCAKNAAAADMETRSDIPTDVLDDEINEAMFSFDPQLYVAKSRVCDGFGLFASMDIKQGSIVVAMNEPHQVLKQQADTYLRRHSCLPEDAVVHDERGGKKLAWYDASFTDDESRPHWHFLNHSGKANTAPRVCGAEGRFEWIARKAVRKGDELTFDYGEPDESWRASPGGSRRKRSLRPKTRPEQLYPPRQAPARGTARAAASATAAPGDSNADTFVCKGSWNVATTAAAVVTAAVDRVMLGNVSVGHRNSASSDKGDNSISVSTNAFCVVRPPGHHAGYVGGTRKKVPCACSTRSSDSGSMHKPMSSIKEGRWDGEEHQLFEEGVKIFGKDWQRVAEHIETRTAVQCRTHFHVRSFKGDNPYCTDGFNDSLILKVAVKKSKVCAK
jgi:hypothetical protein